ncbi:MAG: Hpt domain-containing protein [Treponema sp.]|jgi:HPt (histidine-containing phosphotransfer) domain-containing protein|nr:Hpt domain-containing protein [Treponema sp.]
MAVLINQEEGLKRMMNNKKLYTKLLNKFKAETNLNEIESLIKVQDYEKAQISVHTLKGISGNLSLTALYEQLLSIESQIKNRSVDENAVNALIECFNNTMKAIDGVIAVNG